MIHGIVRAQDNEGDVNLIVLLNLCTGTKNVAKSMKSIAIGPVKRAGDLQCQIMWVVPYIQPTQEGPKFFIQVKIFSPGCSDFYELNQSTNWEAC